MFFHYLLHIARFQIVITTFYYSLLIYEPWHNSKRLITKKIHPRWKGRRESSWVSLPCQIIPIFHTIHHIWINPSFLVNQLWRWMRLASVRRTVLVSWASPCPLCLENILDVEQYQKKSSMWIQYGKLVLMVNLKSSLNLLSNRPGKRRPSWIIQQEIY